MNSGLNVWREFRRDAGCKPADRADYKSALRGAERGLDHVEDVENFVACFDEANDLAVDRDEDGAGRRRREFDDDFLREGMALAINFRRHDFAAHTFFLPTGRK